MRAKTQNTYCFFGFINPYKKKISFYVTFHTSGIIACKHMGAVDFRYRFFVTQFT